MRSGISIAPSVLMHACRVVAVLACLGCTPGFAAGAELQPKTVEAYEAYLQGVRTAAAEGRSWLDEASPQELATLRAGEILAWPGAEDGILKVPGGLIHHWRGAAFIPDTTLAEVVGVAQDYPAYSAIYPWVTGSALLDEQRQADPRRERFRLLLRIRRSANVVTSTVDVWSAAEYRYPAPGRAVAFSDANCVRDVKDAGQPDERRLPAGQGDGYLWRANTYTTYLERDGGVYVDLQTLGLSRGFPPLLGWLIEPIARRLGRGSAADTLAHLRRTATTRARGAPAPAAPNGFRLPTTWCGGRGN